MHISGADCSYIIFKTNQLGDEILVSRICNASLLEISPREELVTMIGKEARFTCTSASEGISAWLHQPAGSNNIFEVHLGGFGLVGRYHNERRHSIHHKVGGADELSISNVQHSDTGIYICTNGLGQSANATLKANNGA